MRRLENTAVYTKDQVQAAQGIRKLKPTVKKGVSMVIPVGEVGPKGLLTCAIRGLFERNSSCLPLIRGCFCPDRRVFGTAKQYARIFEDMRLQAINDPKKTLVREITFYEEHLNCLRKSCALLKRTLGSLDKVLDPNSFYTPDGARRAQYQLEKALIHRLTEKFESKEKELNEMMENSGSLISKARIGVEIRDEDHGKAIFVFTAVTTVFLPLSFITSYFGMNFADLRDTHWNQVMYWVIAGPATFVIVAMTLIVAYNTDELRHLFASANEIFLQAMIGFGLAVKAKVWHKRSERRHPKWMEVYFTGTNSESATEDVRSESQGFRLFIFSGASGRWGAKLKGMFSKSESESTAGSSETGDKA
ncbi:cora-like Mg2+ transporter protein-domain-containing protein [Phyllosticta capitalensis]